MFVSLAITATAITLTRPGAQSQPAPTSGPVLWVAAGFSVERVAGPPLVNRPIVADFDDEGRLYVADSSGSNDKTDKQLEERPHRIVRLEDVDGDGRYDKSIVFADKMMFPEGTMWFDGSLYVSAPPSIWKLTDTDGDGVADKREEWWQGKTLTGCANDLHGPYLGPDGWIYWTKGAFAEQTYERPGRAPLVTRASHILRRKPGDPAVDIVMRERRPHTTYSAVLPGARSMCADGSRTKACSTPQTARIEDRARSRATRRSPPGPAALPGRCSASQKNSSSLQLCRRRR